MTASTATPFDKYSGFESLGEGGFGKVFKAVDASLGRTVVIKELRPQLMEDEVALRNFEQEAQRAARINHPHVVTIYESGRKADGTPYIAMEYVDGPSLHQLLEKQPGRRLPADKALAIFEDISAGLDAVHRTGLLHRDIKPSNILLTQDGRAKLSDFGLAAALNTSFVASSMRKGVSGSVGFIAPESEEDGEYSAASDIYGLGQVLYLMLAGRRRHFGDAPLHQLNPQLSPAVTAVVDQAMAREPDQRYATAGAMLAAFKQALRQPVQPAKGKKKSRRGALTVALLTLVGLLIAGMLIAPQFLGGGGTPATPAAPPVAQSATATPDAAAVAAAGAEVAALEKQTFEAAAALAETETAEAAVEAARIQAEMEAVSATETAAAPVPTETPDAAATTAAVAAATATQAARATQTAEARTAATEAAQASKDSRTSSASTTPIVYRVAPVTSAPLPTLAPINPASFARPASPLLEGAISEDTVLAARSGPFIVKGALDVRQGVTLLIEPGTVVKFMDDAHLRVYGSLRAQGLPDQEIVFTSIKDDLYGGDSNQDGNGSAPAPGDWTYIGFHDSSNDANSIIQHALIRYAGEYRGSVFGAIYLEAASPRIVNNTIMDSFGYAISASADSFPGVVENTLIGNRGNGIEIRGGTLPTSGAWLSTDLAYSLTGVLNVAEGATLGIAPGAVIKFGDNVYIEVFGSMNIQGTSEQQIVLTSIKDDEFGGDTNGDGESSVPSPGDWTMIRFKDSSNDANSIIAHCLIRYAGEHNGNRFGAIHLEAASPTVQDNTFERNFWYAISADVNSFPVMARNYLGMNGGNGIHIQEGTLAVSGAWSNTDVAYAVYGVVTIKEGATLSIDPGVTVKFADNSFFEVDGTLKAQGTAGNKITFTSIKDDLAVGDTNGDGGSSAPSPGDWTMIRFRDSSNDANSIVQYATLRYAGEHNGNRFGAIHLVSASPTIRDNVITHSYWYAISADTHSFPTVSGNQIERNAGNGLEVRGGDMRVSGIWKNTDVIYAVLGAITVNESATLGIDPGVQVKLGDNVYFDVFGTFRAIGAKDDPVVFTAIKDDAVGGDTNGDESSSAPSPGDWTMIRFRDSSNDTNSTVQYATLRYAGEHNGNLYGAIHLESASPTIRDNVISNSFWYTLSADPNSFPKISNNRLIDNTGNGLEMRSGDMNSAGAWTNADIVYVVTGPITVRNSATLTIGPSVIVKFAENSFININGALRITGTASQKVTLTSLRDDVSGGDTNGDGDSSTATSGDWTMLRFYDESNDANCLIDYAVIRYAGRWHGEKYGAIHILSASPTVRNSTISDSYHYGIWYDSGSNPALQNNTFARNADGDVYRKQ